MNDCIFGFEESLPALPLARLLTAMIAEVADPIRLNRAIKTMPRTNNKTPHRIGLKPLRSA